MVITRNRLACTGGRLTGPGMKDPPHDRSRCLLLTASVYKLFLLVCSAFRTLSCSVVLTRYFPQGNFTLRDLGLVPFA